MRKAETTICNYRKRNDDYPRSMRDAAVCEHRRAMLSESHMLPLTSYVHKLRKGGKGQVPDFDPLDGGINAQILFLFEKPGPKTSDGRGSGFISRNNDDPTAEATFEFMQSAGIPRQMTLTWNLVPWWNGTRKVTATELRQGVKCVAELLTLLPNLRAVVLVGRRAAQAERYFVSFRQGCVVAGTDYFLVFLEGRRLGASL